jgi:hypothetical protein
MHIQDTSTVEEWRPVVGMEDVYSVSSLGRIRRDKPGIATEVGHILCLSKNPGGYLKVSLYPGGGKKTRRYRMIHCVVAEAFLGPRPVGFVVNHKDGQKANNHSSNLEYVTPKRNIEHAQEMGLSPKMDRAYMYEHGFKWRYGDKHYASKLDADKVREARRLYADGGISFDRLARRYGVSFSTIRDAILRIAWKHVS